MRTNPARRTVPAARWAAVVALVLVAACGTSAVPSASPSLRPTPTPAAQEVTLTDAGCTAPTTGEIPSGQTSITVRNETSSGSANFELVRLTGSFEDADTFLADVRAGAIPPPGELPFIAEELDRTVVEPGVGDELVASVSAGLHAVVCVPLDKNEDIITAFVVGPYVVGDE